MDIRDSLFIMRLRAYVEGAKRASQQACDNEQPDKWMLGYSNAMYDVLEYMDTLDGVRAKIDEEMNKMERTEDQ